MHKDTEFDLRQCERGAQPQHRRAVDLTHNLKFAKTAVAVADRFFQFNLSEVYFSGYAQDDEDVDYQGSETLYVEIWEGTHLHYSVEFLHSGLQGLLHVDLLSDLQTSLKRDLLGAIRDTMNRENNLNFNLPRIRSAQITPDNLTVTLDLVPW